MTPSPPWTPPRPAVLTREDRHVHAPQRRVRETGCVTPRPRRWDAFCRSPVQPATASTREGATPAPAGGTGRDSEPVRPPLTDRPPSTTGAVWGGSRGRWQRVRRPHLRALGLSVARGVNGHLRVSVSQTHEGQRGAPEMSLNKQAGQMRSSLTPWSKTPHDVEFRF